ncbi:hypothetical protein VMCG_09286 [Cytospora schulzeri]|uniref:Acyltransferase MbtK/IucB-like conserved domain-containing protein n=1 Tax=Cytospora schulzeri TaxID=448051 RepID=A0A423VMD8_9PEZI|nr:hypothetical protein VMCG_09286 [Valsa malicola]
MATMKSSTIHLPDGQTYTVQPVFGGLFFKSHELNKNHPSPFPIGWTVVIHTEDNDSNNDSNNNNNNNNSSSSSNGNRNSLDDDDYMAVDHTANSDQGQDSHAASLRRSYTHSFTSPTLQNDNIFISSISNPSSAHFKPAASPTRQIAMMLWITLYWYFHQPPPSKLLPDTEASRHTAPEGRPRGDWRVNIKRDGVLRGRNLIPKLERMGLIASLDSAVGSSVDDSGEEWANMFVSQKMFWQIPGRLFLFTLQPAQRGSGSRPVSPASSRPGSPVQNHQPQNQSQSPTFHHLNADLPGAPPPQTLASAPSFPISPFYSSSHLPTYYPPSPLQYTFSNNTRHPVRPKPPRMGEVFYTRFIPSVGRYLSFRVASSSPKAIPYLGPVSSTPPENQHLTTLCDIMLVQMWLSNPRVAKFWGGYVPNFLTNALASRHSFPAIGMWDGVPFGYFEIYWVKEDVLGRYADADDWDRGLHVFVGEEWARGTMSVCIEPRVDNQRFIQHLQAGGFVKEKEITFPHKQSWFGRLRRENWDGSQLAKAAKSLLVAEALWSLVNGLLRVAAGQMLYKIFKAMIGRWPPFIIMIISAALALASIVQVFLICRPFAAQWDPRVLGTCGDQIGSFMALESTGLSLDVAILAVPAAQTLRLNLSMRNKVRVILVLDMGAIVLVVTGLRMAALRDAVSPDFTYCQSYLSLLSAAGSMAGIIYCASPALRALVVKVVKRDRRPTSSQDRVPEGEE